MRIKLKKRVLSTFLVLVMTGITLSPAMPVDAGNSISIAAGEQNGEESFEDQARLDDSEIGYLETEETKASETILEAGQPGLKAEYFTIDRADLAFEFAKETDIDPNISYPKDNNNLDRILRDKAGAADYVGIKWTGYLNVPETGKYTFYTYSDNGVRMYLHGDLLIDWWVNDWDKEQTSRSINLIAGETYEFRFDYMELVGGQHVTLSWSNDQGISKTIVPASAFTQPEEIEVKDPLEFNQSKIGLLGKYYTLNNDYTFRDLKSVYIDNNIDVASMDDVLNERILNGNMGGVRWTGGIIIPEDANYTFSFYSDNGAKLAINNEEMINWWVNSYDVEQTSKSMYLEAGVYNFKMDYMEVDGLSHVYLYWKNDVSISNKETIPATQFCLPADYDGSYIEDIDTSQAQLDKDADDFGGIISVLGENFNTENLAVELVGYSGRSLSHKILPEIVEASDTKIQFKVPETLKTGAFRVKVTFGDISVISATAFSVTTDSGVSDRPEYPRPDWERSQWMSLNGWWDFSFDKNEVGKTEEWFDGTNHFTNKINVPFCWESELSGIGNTSYLGVAWYQRELVLDETWDNRELFIKFGAVDWKCSLYVNGNYVGDHEGGYTAFEFDITSFVNPHGVNRITLMVEDKSSYGDNSYPALVGKQGTNAPCGYTHTSGIWQSVYLEGRSKTYMNYVHFNPNIDDSTVQIDISLESEVNQNLLVEYDFKSILYDQENDADVLTGSTFSGEQWIDTLAGNGVFTLDPIAISNQKLWNYDEANLYQGTITIKAGDEILDKVSTYFGQRKIETKIYGDNDIQYIFVNNKPVYLTGLLDQGFWPEGIYTAPSADALKFDIQAMRDRGFNMIRKHLKIEDPIEYYWADKLGMFVWQDMPHATAMVPLVNQKITAGAKTPGRDIYKYALEHMLTEITYNHPSVIAVMLFNETWGLGEAYGAWDDRSTGPSGNPNNPNAWDKVHMVNNEGVNTYDWVTEMYNLAKELNPNILIEDMSPCNADHIQSTDLNTFHYYNQGYTASKNAVKNFINGLSVGSSENYKFGDTYEGQPALNSEFGGVAAYDGDWDVSWCFKYQTDIQRQYAVLNGFVYTEPFDVEYERNGILTYDRRSKIFGYNEVAYGGDMRINDLLKPEYVGLDVNPSLVMKPGAQYKAPAVTIRWTDEELSGHTLKWRFDATDVYGNNISTDLSGSISIDFKPYQREENVIEFTLPYQECVGTLTAWIEDSIGKTVVKNFVNVIVSDNNSSDAIEYVNNSVILRSKGDVEFTGVGETTLEFTLPDDFDLNDLNQLRLLTEASSLKGATTTNSAYAQTTEGSELPTDVTILINGIEVDTVLLSDNPRDIRGTLTLSPGIHSGASAGDFGYLININLTDEKIAAIKAALGTNSTIEVTYQIKSDAENKGGIRIYGESNGRYMVNPTLIINPEEIYQADSVITINNRVQEIAVPDINNYSIESLVSGDAGILFRYNEADNTGYYVGLKEDGNIVELTTISDTTIGTASGSSQGEHLLKVTIFDDHIKVYVDNNPEAVIDTYDFSGYAGSVAIKSSGNAAFHNLIISPESYSTNAAKELINVQYADHFVNAQETFTDRYNIIGGSSSFRVNTSNKLSVNTTYGDKAVVNNISAEDLIIEADMTITQKNSDGNMGFIFRGSNFTVGADNANGYYAGIGIEDRSNQANYGQGFVILGRMDQGWTQLDLKFFGEMNINETHRLRVEAVGSRIRVYLDENTTPIIDVYEDTYTSGGVAIRGFLAAGTIDNLVISTAPRYHTDFSNNNITEWQTMGQWSVDGKLLSSGSSTALVGNESWSDYQMSVDVSLEADSVAGLVTRGSMISGKLTAYEILIDKASNYVQFVLARDGVTKVLDKTEINLDEDAYTVTVRSVNNTHKVYLDNKLVLHVVDNNLFYGKAGVINQSGTAVFDNVDVKDRFVFEDNFENGTLKGWNIIAGDMNVADHTLTIPKGLGLKLVDGYTTWDDYVLSAKIKLVNISADKSNGGFIFRSSDFDTGQDDVRGYVAGINYNPKTNAPEADRSGIELGELKHGWRSIKNDHDSVVIEPERWYDFEVKVEGSTIAVSVDGLLCYEVTDTVYSYGMFGLRNFNSGLQVQSLKVVPIDEWNLPTVITDLQALVTEMEKIILDGYTTQSKEAFIEALEAAKVVLLNDDAAQNDIDNAYLALLKAKQALTVVNKDRLAITIALANERKEKLDFYVAAGQEDFLAALEEALAVSLNTLASQSEVDQAISTLTNAMEILKKKADKSDLESLLTEMNNINLSKYTTASVNSFNLALAAAKAVYENSNLSVDDQTLVEEQVANLKAAKSALVLKASSTRPNTTTAKNDKNSLSKIPSSAGNSANWRSDDKGWWLITTGAAYAQNEWKQVDAKWYYFDPSGYMATGWRYLDQNWYYLWSDGSMATGWVLDNECWYYLWQNGSMATGWVLDNGYWYYLRANGSMATGWVFDNGNWYYLNANGTMAVNNNTPDGYPVNQNGQWIQ